MYAHYDPEVDIATLLFTDSSAGQLSDEMSWGLVHHDEKTDEVVGVEVWEASKRLPPEVVAALPPPKLSDDVPESRRAA